MTYYYKWNEEASQTFLIFVGLCQVKYSQECCLLSKYVKYVKNGNYYRNKYLLLLKLKIAREGANDLKI